MKWQTTLTAESIAKESPPGASNQVSPPCHDDQAATTRVIRRVMDPLPSRREGHGTKADRRAAQCVWLAGREESQEHSPDTIYRCYWYTPRVAVSKAREQTCRENVAGGGGPAEFQEKTGETNSYWAGGLGKLLSMQSINYSKILSLVIFADVSRSRSPSKQQTGSKTNKQANKKNRRSALGYTLGLWHRAWHSPSAAHLRAEKRSVARR